MNRLSFENRVSLSRKSVDIIQTVEELSSSYAKREEFVLTNSHLFTTHVHTSEVCTVFAAMCVAIVAGAVGIYGLVYTVAVAFVAAVAAAATICSTAHTACGGGDGVPEEPF